jgi:hypothetical protein
MMVPKRSLLVASAALLCLGTASAQNSHTQKVRRVTKPLIQADLDLSTGKYTIGSKVNQKGAPQFNTSRSLSNVDFAGFVGIDSVQCEWFDEATKGAQFGGKSEVMTSFLFAYCSSALATQSGGVGGSATVSFVEGYTTPAIGGPRPAFNTRTAVYNLSGLPANTGSSSFFGGFNCFFLRVRTATQAPNPQTSFDGGQCLADGTLGWSWDFRDLSNFAPLAHTFPFLACVTSCSGVGPDGAAMTDGVDQYCGNFPNNPPFNLKASFTFGTVTTYTSVNMEVREANALTGASTLYNPTGPGGTNPAVLTSELTPKVNQLWRVALDCSAGTKALAVFVVELKPGPPPPPALSPFGTGNLLVALSPTKLFFKTKNMAGIAKQAAPLPCDLQFLNACYEVQGLCASAPKGFFTNALRETVGSM